MKNIILFGAPGSGKGTQAPDLSEMFNIPIVSVGDFFRKEVKEETALGKEAKDYMEKGLLVPDELVTKIIEANLPEKGFVLDGYPRNLAQAKKLDEILVARGAKVDHFLYFNVDEETVISRLSNRRLCKECNALYHLVNMPPKQEGVCDKCGGELFQRKDDNMETIKKRWEVFTQESASLLDYYRQDGRLTDIDAKGNKEQILGRIKQAFG